MARKEKDRARRWFQNADAKSHSYRTLSNDAIAAIYNVDNKNERSPISEAIEKSGASFDSPQPSNMELKLMPAAQALGELVEIRMKCLILAEGESSWGHDLGTLWTEIRYGVRRQIQEHYSNYVQREKMPNWVSAGKLEEDIRTIGDFISWRYEPTPNPSILVKYITLIRINHVLEHAMLRYRCD